MFVMFVKWMSGFSERMALSGSAKKLGVMTGVISRFSSITLSQLKNSQEYALQQP